MCESYVFSTNVRKCFAEKLKEQREKCGLTQEQLAEKLGVSRGSISYYENMDRVPDIEFLVKAKKFFNISTDYLLGETKNSIPEYQDIGLILGLSDKAISHIMDMNDMCGKDVFNFLAESDSFISLAAILERYLSGNWGYQIDFNLQRKITDDSEYHFEPDYFKDYMRESGYTEYLMSRAIIDLLKDIRIEYDKASKEWQNEMSTTEKDTFTKLWNEIEELGRQYNKVKKNKHEICPHTIEEAYNKLLEKIEEFELFKTKHAQVAEIKKRLSKIESALTYRDEYYSMQKEGETNGNNPKERE